MGVCVWLKCVAAGVVFYNRELLECHVFSLHISKHKWGYVLGGIYAMRCASLFFSPIPISLIIIIIIIFIFFLLWLKTWKGVERICDAAKTEKATHFNLSLKRREKSKKCMVYFYLAILQPLPSVYIIYIGKRSITLVCKITYSNPIINNLIKKLI